MVISLTFKKKQTMKKIFVLMASAAVLFAACNKMEEVNTPVDTPVETEVITIDINPMTKTSLDGKATVWSKGDAVSVTVGDKNIGSLKLVEGSTFSGEVEAGHTGAATLNYPAGVTTVPATQAAVAGSFANGAALLEGTTTMEALRAGEGVELQNKTALLQFTVAQAGDVTFEVGTAKYTVTGCETDKIYYACVAPASNVAFTARIGGYLSKKASSNVTFTANKIANLETLPAPVASDWTVVGTYNNWKTDETAMKLYEDVSGFVLQNFTPNGEFKMVNNGKWYSTMVPTAAKQKWSLLKENMANITRADGSYDVWISEDGKELCLMNTGTDAPSITDANRQYFIVLQHNWVWSNRKLYAWNASASDTELFGTWPGKSPDGTFTYDDNGYSYWEIPNSVYGKKLGFIFSNNGADQTIDTFIENYRDDKRYWLEWKDPDRVPNSF